LEGRKKAWMVVLCFRLPMSFFNWKSVFFVVLLAWIHALGIEGGNNFCLAKSQAKNLSE
jgi:hypothetical protein